MDQNKYGYLAGPRWFLLGIWAEFFWKLGLEKDREIELEEK